MTEIPDDAKQWELAKEIAKGIGYFPASFVTTVRLLIDDQLKNEGVLCPATKFQTARLFKGGSFKSMLYHATETLRGGYIAEKEYVTVGNMMDMYEAFDLATLIACYVFYRKTKKVLGPENWARIEEELSEESQIAAHIGEAIPSVGIGFTLLVGTVHHFAIGMHLLRDEKAFKQYRRDMRKKDERYDLDLEKQLWGCSRLQTSMILLCNMGFGIDITESYTAALDPTRKFAGMTEEFHRRMKIGALWIDCLYKEQDQPIERVPGEYYPMANDRKRLEAEIKKVRQGGIHWLDRGRDDISPEKTPRLFKQAQEESEIPEELQDVFSMDDITSMEEEDFEDLLDQIESQTEKQTARGSTILASKDLEDLEGIVE